jgi:A/G-specific adenine glycosylase
MTKTGNQGRRFVSALLRWNASANKREMPWKGEKNPYKIWLSEVILQQTRVEQGKAYYERFIKTFPDIKSLARAPEEKVLKLWEGLGYYSRCRNLIHTAKYIYKELGGQFPTTYEQVLSLKGIGPYTAAAISSFAYDLPYAVLDGNVFRVLSRIFDIEKPIDSHGARDLFQSLSSDMLPPQQAADYNQAMMDFGAVICKPLPLCAECFFNRHCAAYLAGKQLLLPVKQKKAKRKERWFNYIVLEFNGMLALRKRPEGDIWQSLYEPVLIETPKKTALKKILSEVENEFGFMTVDYKIASSVYHVSQKLTHQQIHFSFIHLFLNKRKKLSGFEWIRRRDFSDIPFPKTVRQVLMQEGYWQKI